MQPKVSMIIPAYNAEKHLRIMLDSIYAQTYPNIEVIVAYDVKSTDTTLQILREYQTEKSLIIDEGKDNSSGQARNRGIKLATGDFVIFVDADDIMIPSYISDMMRIFIQHPELEVVGSGRLISSEGEREQNYNRAIHSDAKIEIYSSEKAQLMMLNQGRFLSGGPWAWLVKRDYLQRYNIQFPNYSYGDDAYYVWSIISNTDKIGFSHRKGYIWILHPSSLLNSISSVQERYNKFSKSREDILKLLSWANPELCSKYNAAQWRIFAFDLAKTNTTYADFREILRRNDIKYLSCMPFDSMMNRLGTYCFNVSKFMFWMIVHFVYHK